MVSLRASLVIVTAVCSCFIFAPAFSEEAKKDEKPKPQTAFEFDEFQGMVAGVPNNEVERLCGLDKICVTLWKKGKLQIYKEGRVFRGDFNQDGVQDEAIILERDASDDDPEDKEFLVCITTPENGLHKVLLHEVIPGANNVVEVFVDEARKALVIDTGGRIIRSQSMASYGDMPLYPASAKEIKVVVLVVWNPKTKRFDLVTPALGKTKHSSGKEGDSGK